MAVPSLFQRKLAAHVRVPVATSSLIQVPWILGLLPPGQRVGVITVSAGSLLRRIWRRLGCRRIRLWRDQGGGLEFFRVLIWGESEDMDVALAAHPDVEAIVLECTNMPPYAHALRAALRVPVFDVYSLVARLHAGLWPRDFGVG